MLWRVRTTLTDRPGSLALLAEQCGAAEINILGLQIFPEVEAVTDELVLRTPADWAAVQVVRLVESAGGRSVIAAPCSQAALADQPTRYVQAARQVLDRPTSFPRVMARLFDAEAGPSTSGDEDVLELSVGDMRVQLHRATPFTATEHARGAAVAALVGDALRRRVRDDVPPAEVVPVYTVRGDVVSATVDGAVVALATVHEPVDLPGVHPVTVRVEPEWRRRGIGTRLLRDAGRLVHERGGEALSLTSRADDPAVMPLVLAAGLRGLIRMAGEELHVQAPVRELGGDRVHPASRTVRGDPASSR